MIKIDIPTSQIINGALFKEEVIARFPELGTPINEMGDYAFGLEGTWNPSSEMMEYVLFFPDDIPSSEMQTILDAHDPNKLTSQQMARQVILNQAQSSEGVGISNLDQGQINALLVVLLSMAGGVDFETMTVRRLTDWVPA